MFSVQIEYEIDMFKIILYSFNENKYVLSISIKNVTILLKYGMYYVCVNVNFIILGTFCNLMNYLFNFNDIHQYCYNCDYNIT